MLVRISALSPMIADWRELLSGPLSEEEYETIRLHEKTGRPLGNESFLNRLENLTARILRKQKPGPKRDN